MIGIKTDEDAKKCIEDLIETLKAVLISLDGDVAWKSVAEYATALARSHVEDSYLTDKKNTGQECVFVMKHGRLYYGIIKEYDDKVITLQARSASYPQDVLLYRTELSTISCERTNDV